MRVERGTHGYWMVFSSNELIGWVKQVSDKPVAWRGFGQGWKASKTHFDIKQSAAEQLEKDWKERI